MVKKLSFLILFFLLIPFVSAETYNPTGFQIFNSRITGQRVDSNTFELLSLQNNEYYTKLYFPTITTNNDYVLNIEGKYTAYLVNNYDLIYVYDAWVFDETGRQVDTCDITSRVGSSIYFSCSFRDNGSHQYYIENTFTPNEEGQLYKITASITKDFQSDINSSIDNQTNELIQNQNNNANQIIQNQNTNTDKILSTQIPGNDDFSNFLNQINENLPGNNVISSLITIPLTFMNNVLYQLQNPQCSAFNLGSVFGTNLQIPCIDLHEILGTNIYNIIDAITTGLLCYYLSKKIINMTRSLFDLNTEKVMSTFYGGA